MESDADFENEDYNNCKHTLDDKYKELGQPLQLIELLENEKDHESKSLQLNEKTLDSIVKGIENMPISIFSICGPSRQGKSFIMGYVIRYLEGLENRETDDWIGEHEPKKPLKGFKFQNNVRSETQGIWIWSRPFIIKDEVGDEVAVLLMDTQGYDDEFTTTKDISAIIGLGVLAASVTIFNVFTSLQEEALASLNRYVQYGTLALKYLNEDEKPFQNLTILIRDWNTPGVFHYGAAGGQKFLAEKLSLKERQSMEAQLARKYISKCFSEIKCFLLPHIGEEALGQDFTGSFSELSPKFAQNLKLFIEGLFPQDNLIKKEVLGNPVSASQLATMLGSYIEVFNSEEVPSAKSLWKVTYQITNKMSVHAALKKYSDVVQKELLGNEYLQSDDLETIHCKARQQARIFFKKARKFGSPEVIEEYRNQLEALIKEGHLRIKEENDLKRTKFIEEVIMQYANNLRLELEKSFPLTEADDGTFYYESEVEQKVTTLKSCMFSEVIERLNKESDDPIRTIIDEMDVKLKGIFSEHMEVNNWRKKRIEESMESIVSDLLLDYRSKMTNYLEENKYEDDNEPHMTFHESLKNFALEEFKRKQKPSNARLEKNYKDKLSLETDQLFITFMKNHRQKIDELESIASMEMQTLTEQFKKEMLETMSMYESMSLEELRDQLLKIAFMHKSQSLLESFRLTVGLPREGTKLNELEAKLMTKLESANAQIANDALQQKQNIEEIFRAEIENICKFYKDEITKNIKEIETDVKSSKFDDIYQKAFEDIYQKAFVEAASEINTENRPGNFQNIIKEFKDKLSTYLQTLIDERARKRDEDQARARQVIEDCVESYEKFLNAAIDEIETHDDLDECHKLAMRMATEKLEREMPFEDKAALAGYKHEISGKVTKIYEEILELYQLKAIEEEANMQDVYAKAQEFYKAEMQKHFTKAKFMQLEDLKQYHAIAKKIAEETYEAQQRLSIKQKLMLSTYLEEFLPIYIRRNDMNLNSMSEAFAPAIGIDLGTTYCCVAVYVNGKVNIIPNVDQGSDLTTPSYVAFDNDGNETVGRVAKINGYRNPENTIYDAKRIIGRKIDDRELIEDMKYWPFTIMEDEGVPKIKVNEELYHPEQISAKLLKFLRRMAEKFLKLPDGTIKKAVITVPAYFNDGQRLATVHAGKLAGLEVLTILSEPTAAAIAYSLERFNKSSKKILVYDLGGGTFDVALLDMKPREIYVLAVTGDTHLGGDDFEKNMMRYCAEKFQEEHKDELGSMDLFNGKDSGEKQMRDKVSRRLRRLQTHCELAKRDLSAFRSVTVEVDALMNGEDLCVEITREKFEELNKELFEKTIELVDKVLLDTGLCTNDIDEVLLVGGSSRIPRVQELLMEYFKGKRLNNSIHPDHAVAYGAAVQAALLNGIAAKVAFGMGAIRDVTPMSLGIENYIKGLSIIIPKNTPIPAEKTETYFTAEDNQSNIKVKIFQGEDTDFAARNNKLGEFTLDGIPPAKQGKEPIDICMKIDGMGILHVSATIRSSRGTQSITVNEDKQRMSEETIEKLISKGI